MAHPSVEEIRFLRLPDVERRVGLKKTTIYRLVKFGMFPAPRKLAGVGNVSVWPDVEIHQWQRAQMGA